MSEDRVAVLEVMIEMLTTHDMMRQANPDQSLDDYRDTAVMMLCQRHAEEEMDDLLDVLDQRLANVRRNIEIVRQQIAKERH